MNYKIYGSQGKFEETLESSNIGSNVNKIKENNMNHYNLNGVIHDTCSYTNMKVEAGDEINDTQVPNEETKDFFQLIKYANVKLYPTCEKLSKLFFCC